MKVFYDSDADQDIIRSKKVGGKLRGMMPWIAKGKIVDQSVN